MALIKWYQECHSYMQYCNQGKGTFLSSAKANTMNYVNTQASTIAAEGTQKPSLLSVVAGRRGLLLLYKGRQVLAENQKVLLNGWKDGGYSTGGEGGIRQLPYFIAPMNQNLLQSCYDVSISLSLSRSPDNVIHENFECGFILKMC